MLLLIDHLALRARNYEYLIRLFQEWEVGASLVRSRGGTDICFFCFLGLVSVCSGQFGDEWSSSEGRTPSACLVCFPCHLQRVESGFPRDSTAALCQNPHGVHTCTSVSARTVILVKTKNWRDPSSSWAVREDAAQLGGRGRAGCVGLAQGPLARPSCSMAGV